MYLVPDLSTFVAIPWEMDLSTARVICDVHTPDGEPFAGDPRHVLKRQIRAGGESGPGISGGTGVGVLPRSAATQTAACCRCARTTMPAIST